jgi:DNA uptake protein ComE-like DNA-binding protein
MSLRKLLFPVVFALGCASTDAIDPENAAPSAFALSLSTADAALVLDLVNYPGASEANLDEDAGLDWRAARDIQAHRAGADGLFPSNDDNLFDSVAELDAVPYVGDVAFEKLVTYAHQNPPPAGEVVEGVTFRGWEAESVVWGVNTAPIGVLDGMLDARAAQNLVAARPFTSVAAMGPIGYVGASALGRLRDEAPVWWAARAGSTTSSLAGTFDGVTFDETTAVTAIEIANQATHAQMVAHGVYTNGAAAIVGNRPFTTLAEVAAVSGVGTSTMQGLHDYAASGTWSPSGGGGGGGGGGGTHTPPDANCVFGLTYRDIFTLGGTVVVAKRVLDPASSTNATQRTQLVAAVKSVYTNVTTVSQAFAAVDNNEINHLEVWDASNRKAYTAYEFGAGDNSFGQVFVYGTTTVATNIIDGDLYDCTAMWGDEMRPCETTQDCADGLTCHGSSDEVSTGRCIDLQAPSHPQEGNDCSYELGCLPASGLVCAGAATWGSGICVPAWMRGYFQSTYDATPIPDASTAGVTFELPVYGLASVDTDVLLDLRIDHPRPADLRVTLTNPATAEVLIFDGPGGWPASQLNRSGYVVHGFSGDEEVNGIWRLKVEDRAAGSTGEIVRFGLNITSRWD